MIHQRNVDHRGFVDDDDIDLQRVIGVTLESAFARRVFEQAVQCHRLFAGAFGHPFGRPAGGRGEGKSHFGASQDRQERHQQGCFTGSRPAGDDKDFFLQGAPRRIDLVFIEGDRQVGEQRAARQIDGAAAAALVLLPRPRPTLALEKRRRGQQPGDCVRDSLFGLEQVGQIHPREVRIALTLQNHLAALGKFFDGYVNALVVDFEQLASAFCQRAQRQIAMAALRRFAQDMQHAGLHSQREIAANTDLAGEPVGEQKADAMHLLGERIGIFPDLRHRIGAVDPIDAQCQGSADAMALEKHHDILHAALGLPRLHDAARPHLADALDIENPQRFVG